MLSLKNSLAILKETNALLEGHFVLSSGLHSPSYVQCAKLLSNKHQESVDEISARINNPDLTPSAVMLEKMKQEEIGFFEYVDQFSRQYKDLYQGKTVSKDYFSELDKLALSSNKKQLEIEAEDVLCFDDFLTQYFTYNEED